MSSSTTLCSQDLYSHDEHSRRDGDDQGHHRASAVRRASTHGILRGERGAGAKARAWRAGRAGRAGGSGSPAPDEPVEGEGVEEDDEKRTSLGRKNAEVMEPSPTSPFELLPQHHVDSSLRTAHV